MEIELSKENKKMIVSTLGAELLSYKEDNFEYLWQKEEPWSATSPLLFPFIGKIKDDFYTYKDKKYEIKTRHGFARDLEFKIVEQGKEYIILELNENKETLEVYPFKFRLRVKYTLISNGVFSEYEVYSKDNELYFSLGLHPGFLLSKKYDKNSVIKFYEKETLKKYEVLTGGILKNSNELYLRNENIIEIDDEIFKKYDTIIFNKTKSNSICIEDEKRKITVNYFDFPYLAFWKKINANYICVEPWYGIPDMYDTNHKIENKEGIQKLNINEKFKAKMEYVFEKGK